jgi:hypothetical protein
MPAGVAGIGRAADTAAVSAGLASIRHQRLRALLVTCENARTDPHLIGAHRSVMFPLVRVFDLAGAPAWRE